jgi:hypothetical protein
VNGLFVLAAALVLAAVGSELALRGTKLQSGLSRVVIVWGVVWLAALYPSRAYGGIDPVTLTIFWGGAFLSWFGVRSHIESSILLRMLYLLRREPRAEADLLATYASRFGAATRMEELVRGGMMVERDGTNVVTAKGKRILGVVSRLR